MHTNVASTLRSCSDGFSIIRSTETLLPLSSWFSDGCSATRVHILFLANPCRSNVPEYRGCMKFYRYHKSHRNLTTRPSQSVIEYRGCMKFYSYQKSHRNLTARPSQSVSLYINLYTVEKIKIKITASKYDPIANVTRMDHAAAPVGNTPTCHLASRLVAWRLPARQKQQSWKCFRPLEQIEGYRPTTDPTK